MSNTPNISNILSALQITESNNGAAYGDHWIETSGATITSHSPVDGQAIGSVKMVTTEAYDQLLSETQKAFKEWRNVPAPARGEMVRQLGDATARTCGEKVALSAL